MVTIVKWIIANWQLTIAIGVLLVVLTMTGTITTSIRAAKKGLKEAITPLGFIVILVIIYLVYRMYLLMMESI